MNKIIDSEAIFATIVFLACGFIVGLVVYACIKDNEQKSKNFHDTLNTTIACRKVVVKDADKICGAVPVWSQFSGESK